MAKPVEPFEPLFRPPDHPRAIQLRQTHGLLGVAGDGTDFARARRIKTWVRKQWNQGYDQLPAPFDAIDLIDAARNRGMSFQCGHYGQTFTECCLAVGIPARVIGLKRCEADFPYHYPGSSGHIVAEAYCRELGKWVLFDPAANAFYRCGGVPVGALEIHRAWHENKGREIQRTIDDPGLVMPDSIPGITPRQCRALAADFQRYGATHFYHHIVTGTVQGYQGEDLSRFNPKCVCYCGIIQYPAALNFAGNWGEQGHGGFVATRPELFNWPIDRTFARITMLGPRPSRRVELLLEHTMPFFSRFEVSLNGGPFRRHRDGRSVLTLPPGRTRLAARCIDIFGRAGHPATLDVRVGS